MPLEEQPIYTEDWIGLHALAQEDRLYFGLVPKSEHVVQLFRVSHVHAL